MPPQLHKETLTMSKILRKPFVSGLCGLLLVLPTLTGCASRSAYDSGRGVESRGSDAPVAMAPPIATDARKGEVFDWDKVPAGQKVPLAKASFDKDGYQLTGQTGETIQVPFDKNKQNLYVMKFAKTGESGMYFVNENGSPTLYVPSGGYLVNAAEETAKWYPFTEEYKDSKPVAVAPAPNWNAYQNQAYYPGMSSYGGFLLGQTIANAIPMLGLYYLMSNHQRFNSYGGYHDYYRSNPVGRVPNRTVYNYSAPRSTSAFGSRPLSGGSYSGRSPLGGSRPSGSFGGSSPSGFGSASRRSGGSFGSSPSGFGGSFGRPRSSSGGGIFGGGGRSSGGGGFFGGGRSSGGSFGGGRSFGGGFGGRRR